MRSAGTTIINRGWRVEGLVMDTSAPTSVIVAANLPRGCERVQREALGAHPDGGLGRFAGTSGLNQGPRFAP